MSLTAAPRDGLRKIENLLDNKHMENTNHHQTSTPDADICGELRTMSGLRLFEAAGSLDRYGVPREEVVEAVEALADYVDNEAHGRDTSEPIKRLLASVNSLQPAPTTPPPLRGRPGSIDLLRKVTGDPMAAPVDVDECQPAPAPSDRPLYVCRHCGREWDDGNRHYCGCGGPYRIPNPAPSAIVAQSIRDHHGKLEAEARAKTDSALADEIVADVTETIARSAGDWIAEKTDAEMMALTLSGQKTVTGGHAHPTIPIPPPPPRTAPTPANESANERLLQPRLVQPLLNVRQHLVDRATNIGAGTCLQKNEILWAIEVVDNELKWQGHPECHFAADNITERTRTARVETYRKLVADGFTHHASLAAARQLMHVG